MTRHLRFEAVENFRDYGGYPTASGKRIKQGLLYRSASHARATDADLEAIDALDIAVVVDLRRPGEREREPSRRPAGFRGQVIVNDMGEAAGDDPWWNFVRSCDLSEDAFRGYLLNYYREAPANPRHIDLFARYFRALAESDGPVLIHCAAGKDRTGVLAALTHHLAGVHPDDIVEDYLLTNNPERIAARAPMVAQMIAQETGRTATDAAVRAAIGVEAEYLAEAFRSIEAAHGSVDAYLTQALGVDAALKEALEARLFA
ncbi:MAG TPA: tyrosine-protein phosphatase [Caulobacteraceae bacterium]|nr:tyrosine-protein phosphatase [Caulobacteraceae bacterium]